jgi:hypothetical protein
MRQWLLSRLTYANVMVTILAFIVLGGMSYAATGGNFILGQPNLASSTTSLTRTGANTAKGLQVTNTSTGAGATALGLNVASGHAPFTVNSGTKVANLNADKLDGQDSTGFIRGKTLNLVLDASSPGVVTPAATVGPYQISGECEYIGASNTTVVRIHAKGPTGVSEAIWSGVTNDAFDEGNFSRAESLLADVDKVVMSFGSDSGYTRLGGTLVLRSDSGVIVQVDFSVLDWGQGPQCHIFGTATTGT